MLNYVRQLRVFSYVVIFTVFFVALFGKVEVGGMIFVIAGMLIAVDVGAYIASQKAKEKGSSFSNSVIYYLVVVRGSLAALALALVPVIALQFIVNNALSNGDKVSALILAGRVEAFHGVYTRVLSSPFSTLLVAGSGTLVFAAPFLWRSLGARLKPFVLTARLTVFVVFLVGFWGVFSIFSFAVVTEVDQIRFGQIRTIETYIPQVACRLT